MASLPPNMLVLSQCPDRLFAKADIGRAVAGRALPRRAVRACFARMRLPGQGSIEWMLIVALVGILLVAGLVVLQGVMEGKLIELGSFIKDA